jgi:hypothetical protein
MNAVTGNATLDRSTTLLGIVLALFLPRASFARVTITQVTQAAAGPVHEIAVTRQSSRVIAAVRTGSDELKVIVWDVGADGALTRRGDALAGKVTRGAIMDWTEGPGVVTAVRTTSGDLKVIAWKVAADGSVQRAGDGTADPVGEVAISSPPGFAGVVTPVRTTSGDLKVIAWKVSAAAVTHAGDVSGGACSAIAATALSSVGGAARVAVALRNGSGNLEVITWAVTATGIVSRLHEGVAGRSTTSRSRTGRPRTPISSRSRAAPAAT